MNELKDMPSFFDLLEKYSKCGNAVMAIIDYELAQLETNTK